MTRRLLQLDAKLCSGHSSENDTGGQGLTAASCLLSCLEGSVHRSIVELTGGIHCLSFLVVLTYLKPSNVCTPKHVTVI